MTLLEIDWALGGSVTLIGYSVVLLALTFLFGVYKLIPVILDLGNKIKLKREGKVECPQDECPEITGEESAAISTALYMYLNELHDIESGKITIKKVSKRYSPWSSKIYVMNNYKR